MKKFLTTAIIAALVLAVAGPAMAMHFEMNGELRVRSFYFDSYLQDDTTTEFIDQRFRTGLTWGLTEDVFLKARADINEGFWGDNQGRIREEAVNDPVTGEVDLGDFFATGTKEQIYFDHFYGQFVFPGAPVTVVLGRQPVTWGLGAAAAADNRDRAKLLIKAGPGTIVLAYDKYVESFEANLQNGSIEDNHGFAAAYVAPLGSAKAGLLYYYLSNKAAADTQHNTIDGFFDGQFGPVNAKAEVAYRWGKDDLNDRDLEALIIYAGGFLNAGMANLGIELGYSQGDDPNSKDNEAAGAQDYHGPFNSIILFNNLDYDGYSRGSVRPTNKAGDVGLNNALAIKASATASPSEKLSLTGAVIWAQLDKKPMGVTDKDMGVEVDAVLSYSIYDNVTYTLGLGYLWAGDAFGTNADDPFAMMNALSIKF